MIRELLEREMGVERVRQRVARQCVPDHHVPPVLSTGRSAENAHPGAFAREESVACGGFGVEHRTEASKNTNTRLISKSARSDMLHRL
jgi:hypothetical protein